MNNLFFQPIAKPSLLKLFCIMLPITSILFVFINPSKLDASDFMLIAWNPGQELLTKGFIDADYPYPLWTVIMMLPFIIWQPQTSMLLWFICNLLILAASLALFINMFDFKISVAWIGLVTSLSIFFLPVITSMWLGQLTILSLFILALTAHFFINKNWIGLGIALGLSFIKPQVMILLCGLILLWSLSQHRWKVLFSFTSVIFIMAIISVPFISSLNQIIGGGISSHLSTYMQQTSTIWGLLESIGISWVVPAIISLGLILWVAWLWLPALREVELSKQHILFLFCAAMMTNLIAVPYSWMHNLALLLLPCGYCLTLIQKLQRNSRYVWLGMLFFVMHPLMVGLFILFTARQQTQAYQIIPALILLPMLMILEFQVNSQQHRSSHV